MGKTKYILKKGDKINGFIYIGEGSKSKSARRLIIAKCPFCKKEIEVNLYEVASFHTQSCGCAGVITSKYGKNRCKKMSEYNIYCNMKSRCYNFKNKSYHHYGGRGIKVCDRWLGDNGFSNFISDMGHRSSPKHSLDRFPNMNGNYEPKNCRWATQKQQANNTRRNVPITYNGVTKNITEWATVTGITKETLNRRLKAKVPMDFLFMKGHIYKKIREQNKNIYCKGVHIMFIDGKWVWNNKKYDTAAQAQMSVYHAQYYLRKSIVK